MKILKFGGTSMGDEHTWRKIMDIIRRYDRPIVVVSATARTTRQLVSAANAAPKELSDAYEITGAIRDRHKTLVDKFLSHCSTSLDPKIATNCEKWINQCIDQLNGLLQTIADAASVTPKLLDAVASTGEQLSAYLFAECARAEHLKTSWIDASKIIKTDNTFGQAIPKRDLIEQSVEIIAQKSETQEIPVMGGFYGSDSEGHLTTLGFEGSDYTASLIGAALGAETIEIWTDVSGIYTCDPRIVSNARSIPELSFQEATELAYFGAKVLHPSTMKPASEKNIPIWVKNIFEPNQPGTKIHDDQQLQGWAKAMTYLKDIAILTVTAHHTQTGHHFLARVFQLFDAHKISVNAVTTTEASISVALKKGAISKTLKEKLNSAGTLDITNNYGLISLIGCSLDTVRSIKQKVLNSIPDINPSLVSYSRSKRNFNIAVAETELVPAVCRMHKQLFEQPQD